MNEASFLLSEEYRHELIEKVKNLAQGEIVLLSVGDCLVKDRSLSHQADANIEIIVFGVSFDYLNENVLVPGLLGEEGVLKPIGSQTGVSYLIEKNHPTRITTYQNNKIVGNTTFDEEAETIVSSFLEQVEGARIIVIQ